MRSDSFIYGLVLLLIIAVIFSSRQMVKKMNESENNVNVKYFQIQKKYFNQKRLLINLLAAVEKNCGELNDLLPENLPDIPEPNAPEDFNFEQFRAEIKTQEKLDHLIIRTERIIISGCPDLAASTREMLVHLKNEQELLYFMKNDYNKLARQHNAFIKRFPRNFYSNFYHFRSKPYYSSEN